MWKIALSILTGLAEKLDSDDFDEFMDAMIDKAEELAYRKPEGSVKRGAILLGTSTARSLLGVPDDDDIN